MLEILIIAAVSSLLAAFAILFAKKAGVITWLEIHLNPYCKVTGFLRRLIQCEFCLSWWVNLAACVVISIAINYWGALLAAVLATPLTRKIIW